MWRSLVTIIRLIKQQNGIKLHFRYPICRSTIGQALVKPAVWFVRAIVNWSSRPVVKLA